MQQFGILQEFFKTIADKGRRLLEAAPEQVSGDATLASMCDLLLSSVGEASGMAVALRILEEYGKSSFDERVSFLQLLRDRYGLNPEEAVSAAVAFRDNGRPENLVRLQAATEPKRQELLRRLNQAPGGIAVLLQIRQDLLEAARNKPDLAVVDVDFRHLFQSWFNRGFLELGRIDWNTSAVILEKIIKYEAVHAISGWDDLRRRIDLPDRRLYSFFHPRLPQEPLIFLEVALVQEMSGNIADILDGARKIINPGEAKAAIFYSISNCQVGLRGISFGNFLIKQVVEELRREFGNLELFATLSPIPGFASWFAKNCAILDEGELGSIERLSSPEWWRDSEYAGSARPLMLKAAAQYLAYARSERGGPIDPVARFHLGNGAKLGRLNWLADKSKAGLKQSHGIMVNYIYDLAEIERNHEDLAKRDTIAMSKEFRRIAEGEGGRRQKSGRDYIAWREHV